MIWRGFEGRDQRDEGVLRKARLLREFGVRGQNVGILLRLTDY